MKKKQIIILISAVILILIILFANSKITGHSFFSEKKQSEAGQKQITLTKETFPAYFEKQEIIQELPKDAVIGFQFYTYQGDTRIWQEKYTIKKGKVEKKDFESENPDIVIIMHSRNFQYFGNICNAVQTAKKNNDLGYELKISQTSLLWKYKSMLKYKDCMGY